MIDPLGRTFQLHIGADGGFVENRVAWLAGTGEFGTEFLVPVGGLEADAGEDGDTFVEVVGVEFALLAALVDPVDFAAFIGNGDQIAGLADTEEAVGTFDGTRWVVENDVLFENTGSGDGEARTTQDFQSMFGAGNGDFDFNFLAGGHGFRIAEWDRIAGTQFIFIG